MESVSINNPESLSPKSKSNPILGMPVNLLYLEDDDNLAAVVIQEDNTGELFILTAESDLMDETNAIWIKNLKNFQFRLQDALHYDSLVSIYYENNRINSLVIIKQNQGNTIQPPARRSGISMGPPCGLPPNHCPG